jgi:hypothetical protein
MEFIKVDEGKRTLKIHTDVSTYFFNAVKVPDQARALQHIHTACHM